MSPEVAHSSPAIMRSIVVLPQPDGPSRHLTSPLPTSRSALSTATRPLPKRFVSFSSLISYIRLPSLPDGAERHPAQKLVLQQESDNDDGDDEECLDRGEKTPVHADLSAD